MTIVPVGYLTLLQAADALAVVMFGGEPDLPVVGKLRAHGIDMSDGDARSRAIAEIWSAVDEGHLRATAIGGTPRRLVKLDAELTESIPGLRSARGRGFSLLRPAHPAFRQLFDWFGRDFADVVLAFREVEIRKLGHRLARSRRAKLRRKVLPRKRVGRPALQARVEAVIVKCVESGKWSPPQTIKALTREANRLGSWTTPVSEDTVARALKALFGKTGDRRFLHPGRKPRE